MKDLSFTKRWVLVTGASSGLGKEMAIQLARTHHANLILVARRSDALVQLKQTLMQEHNIRCHIIKADLSVPADVDRVYFEAVALGDIYAVILNAGVTYFGEHLEMSWENFQSMLATNVTSVVRLMGLFVPYLIAKDQRGGVMVVSSMTSFLPIPYQSAYAGTKAFVTNFVQSFAHEVSDKNISISIFAPGGINTEMMVNSKLKYFEDSIFSQSVTSCAADALHAMQTRQQLVIPGTLNKAQLLLGRLFSRGLLGSITKKAYQKALA